MTKLFSNPKITSAAFLAAVTVSMFAVGGAKAGTAGNLHQCDSNNRSKTVQCCESLIRNDQADWLRNSGRGCKAAVSCYGKGSFGYNKAAFSPNRYRCYVNTIYLLENQGKDRDNERGRGKGQELR
jgi:hypothetical protein